MDDPDGFMIDRELLYEGCYLVFSLLALGDFLDRYVLKLIEGPVYLSIFISLS